ncbi:helix-hairpin-helix domain-containing protein [Paucibacter sp. APW11]|uniref:Helix-hairpin-helix domain-containing protein n=1 Tax=Roseateles aquae TaxID=3077235 RepID=A0ABU3PAK7_9BURK|nr:helix-hairpin-helix domain-containing protein [Paucibacter sp. APW11]MDT8998786.1 helix-hairpin-helix domain-containing protein [Paucibacter sp. APW11]
MNSPSPRLASKPKAAARAKAQRWEDCQSLAQIPNIGPAMVGDFRLLGIHTPQQLRGQDALALYRRLCQITATRHDPCVLDTLMAATDFMGGAPATPWWHYTAQRKALYPEI